MKQTWEFISVFTPRCKNLTGKETKIAVIIHVTFASSTPSVL